MRIKSAYGKNVYFEPWYTELCTRESLWLTANINFNGDVYFFFQKSDDKRSIYQISINCRDVYRISDKGTSAGFVSKYFKRKSKGKPPSLVKNDREVTTWKIWGTDLVKDVYFNTYISDFEVLPEKKKFQYLISTSDECVEIISKRPLKIKKHRDKKIQSLLRDVINNPPVY